MVQSRNVYLKIIVERYHVEYCLLTGIFGACHLQNIIAHEQNDNQAARKLYLGNIETFRIGQVYYSVNDQLGNKVLFIIVHYRAVEIITEMYLCGKINDPKYQVHVFAV